MATLQHEKLGATFALHPLLACPCPVPEDACLGCNFCNAQPSLQALLTLIGQIFEDSGIRKQQRLGCPTLASESEQRHHGPLFLEIAPVIWVTWVSCNHLCFIFYVQSAAHLALTGKRKCTSRCCYLVKWVVSFKPPLPAPTNGGYPHLSAQEVSSQEADDDETGTIDEKESCWRHFYQIIFLKPLDTTSS